MTQAKGLYGDDDVVPRIDVDLTEDPARGKTGRLL